MCVTPFDKKKQTAPCFSEKLFFEIMKRKSEAFIPPSWGMFGLLIEASVPPPIFCLAPTTKKTTAIY